jgi:hypothetical protein
MRERVVLMNELVCSSAAGNSSPYRIEEELPQGGIGRTSKQEKEITMQDKPIALLTRLVSA